MEEEHTSRNVVNPEHQIMEKNRELYLKTARLESMIMNIADGVEVCNYDDNFTIVHANAKFYNLTGYTREEIKCLLNNKHMALLIESEVDSARLEIMKQLEKSDSFTIEYRIRRKNGDIIWVLDKGCIVKSNSGKKELYCVLTDITLQKKRELELIVSERLYQVAMKLTDLVIFEHNIVTGQTKHESAHIKKFGIGRITDDAIETYIKNGIIHPDSVCDYRSLYEKIYSGQHFAEEVITLIDVNGEESIHELKLETVFDEAGKPIRAIGLDRNITESVVLEKEKDFGNAFVFDRLLNCEANITKDNVTFVDGDLLGNISIPIRSKFSKLIDIIAQNFVEPRFRELYMSKMSKENIINEFNEDKKCISFEYRRKRRDLSYSWYENTINIIQNKKSGDIIIRCYTENINDRKSRQLKLLYKSEHDILTGFYNKSTTESKITGFLQKDTARLGMHAFFIIDLDNFKRVNDAFGHAFGDAVLSETATAIKEIFRDDDILGRIGGDEFVILMKNIQSKKRATTKAQQICNLISEGHVRMGAECQISVSVGIAFYGTDGKTYDELYRYSDAALYIAKDQGKSRCAVYQPPIDCADTLPIKHDKDKIIESKNFEKNMTEYVFRILHESGGNEFGIQSVLGLIGKHYNVSRAYLFEICEDGLNMRKTFEWLSESSLTDGDRLECSEHQRYSACRDRFDANGVFYIPDADKTHIKDNDILQKCSIKTTLQFTIMEKDKFVGFIGFDKCDFVRVFDNDEIADIRIISDILGVFVIKMRAMQYIEKTTKK